MKPFLPIFIFCFLFAFSAKAQLRGKVVTSTNQPIPAVSINLLQDSTFIAGTVSGMDGSFTIGNSLVAGVRYRLQLSLVGYETLIHPFIFPDTVSLAKLQLESRPQVLGEVIVTSKKPLVVHKPDRYIVNVEDSYLANGQNGLEVLQRSPGIWVSPDGAIRITGSASVAVMINDVVQRMSSEDLATFLRSIRSEDISRIEVIPNPPAEFEASSGGGMIHIILKKARKNGLTGTASAAYRIQGKRGSRSAGFSLDYKLPRFYITAALNGGIDKSIYTGYTDVTYPDKTGVYNYTTRDNDNDRYFFRGGIVYDLHPRHSLVFQTTGTASGLDQSFHSTILYRLPATVVNGQTTSDWQRNPRQGSYTINYTWKTDSIGSTLKIITDHTYSIKKEQNEVHSQYTDALFNRAYRTTTPSNTDINTAQADFIQQLKKKSVISTGIKFVDTRRSNNVLTERVVGLDTWKKDSAASDDYRYTEKLLMVYLAYEKTFGKTSIKTGLRGEQTIAEGLSLITRASIRRNYFGWFPSFFLTHVIDDKRGRSFGVNYSRRVRRPGFNDLNPYRLQVHDFTVLTGNPDLVPQYTHSFRMNYVASTKISGGAYVQSTSNYIALTAKQIDSVIEYRSKNYPNSTEYGLFAEGNFTIAKIWNSRTNINWFRLSNTIDAVKYRSTAFNVQAIQVITVKKILNIDLYTQYNSPVYQANEKQAHLFFIDIGFTRVVLKERGRLRFAVTDIFNSFREKNVTDFNQTHIDFYQKRPTRTFGLSFNYTFRSGKGFSKKSLDNNNSDEKSRL